MTKILLPVIHPHFLVHFVKHYALPGKTLSGEEYCQIVTYSGRVNDYKKTCKYCSGKNTPDEIVKVYSFMHPFGAHTAVCHSCMKTVNEIYGKAIAIDLDTDMDGRPTT